VSKLNAVLTGQRPQGDPTLGEVEILQERGFAAFQEPLEQLVAFEKRLSLKLLWITRESGLGAALPPTARRQRRLEAAGVHRRGPRGPRHVDIDLATAWPKSPMLTNLRLSKAFELGILNPQDPEVQEEYLKMNDLLGFKTSTDVDRDQVARQLDTWKQAQTPQQIEPPQPWWRLDYHLFRKSQFLKTEEFEELRRRDGRRSRRRWSRTSSSCSRCSRRRRRRPNPRRARTARSTQAVAKGALKPAAPKGAKGALGRAVARAARCVRRAPAPRSRRTNARSRGARSATWSAPACSSRPAARREADRATSAPTAPGAAV
jgi:hypothetical protein